MTWGAVIGGGAAVIGGALSADATGDAADKQQGAADAATRLQRDQYNQTRADNLPALDARNNALMQMTRLAGAGSGMPSAADVMGSPGYQFGLNQGNANINNGAAANGGLYSGAVGKALERYGTDYATTKYDQSFNRLQTAGTNDFNKWASISGQGQTGANQLAAAGANYAGSVGGLLTDNANAQGASGLAQAGIYQNALNRTGSALKSWFPQQNNQLYNAGYGGVGAGGSPDGYW